MEKSGAGGGGAAAPTGCFKCGRPGHWSRDCPSSTPNPNSDANPNSSRQSSFPSSKSSQQPFSSKPAAASASASAVAAAKKVPKTRPKLTPDLLLSDDGLGYVLRHFPRNFKYRGRGHEVSDLGNLIGLYVQWHSQLIPYYPFDQFVQKVEKVGATKRVRRCVSELRERVARGGDPTKLHEPPTESTAPDDCEPEGTDEGHGVADTMDPPLESHDAVDIQEEMFDEIFQKATEQETDPASQTIATSEVNQEHDSPEATANQTAGSSMSEPSQIQITEEQRVRMEANRLKALERAAARARSSQAS